MNMNEQELKAFFKSTFNAVADGYDSPAMRFFPESAGRIASCLDLRGDEHVLDVATGTGIVALTLAKDLPDGRVIGIDFSEGMLARAMWKKATGNVHNVTFAEMDMQSLEFPDRHFDVAVSAFSIFFVEDMKKLLVHIVGKVKRGGKVLVTTFYENAFSPLVGLFLDRLQKYGIQAPTMAWKRVATEEQCTALFNEAGLHHIKSERVACGYYLGNTSDWWYIICNGGFRGLVNQLSADDLERFQEEHLAEVEALASGQGIWLEMNILYTVGLTQA